MWLVLAPRNLVILLLKGYRRCISPLYGQVCRYYPSCSAYALDAVAQYGVIRGGVMSVRRILRCNPFARGGVDDVPPSGSRYTIDARGFVHSPARAVEG
ncbi:MAG TPA: membrane protein insertion efficiency factor YidD [Pseudoclavibacter sp.]|nr:membrane protein insertion efficiency factor YidD [Pseudoclavibacter sp.]